MIAACGGSSSTGEPEPEQAQVGTSALDPDLNNDGVVNTADLAIAGGCAGKNLTVVSNCRCADTDGDNDVDLTDVRFVRANLRRTGFPKGPNPCIPDPLNVDDDRDGFTENQGDCNDANAAIHPGVAERCNGVDDNCNQAIDDGFQLGDACTAGLGACSRTGVTVCSADGSTTVCNAIPGAATTERCNGADDDCNGTVDDGFSLGVPCTAGLGVCQRSGQTVCAADGSGTVCNAIPGVATTEKCDGADDDCDGTSDEDFDVGTPCSVGVGACQTTGTKLCSADGSSTICDATPGTPAAETCNGLDDNCDSTVDDGFDVGTACSAGVGACATNGTKVCAADGLSTRCNAIPADPQVEVCGNGVDEDCDGSDLDCAIQVRVTSPPNLSLVTDALVDVSGTVDAAALTVECNGFSTLKQGGAFSGVVGLLEGRNPVSCVARGATGNAGVDTIQIVRDTTPPVVVIESPPDGFVTTNSQIDITGAVADVASAAVEMTEMKVMVNGIEASVTNRAFAAPRFLLQPGQNTIMAMAQDAAGNAGSAHINVTLLTQGEEFLQELSGNTQGGTIGLSLPNPLVVRVVDRRGNPVAARSVKFQVTRGDGMVEAFPEKGASVTVNTDDSGLASVSFVLGTRVGNGNNQVTANVVGIPGGVIFCASSSGLRPERIVTVSGSNQTGAVGTNLPVPLITFVTDLLGNPVPGVDVTYQVVAGGGTIAGGSTFTNTTDSDGQAAAVLTLGASEGINNNTVTASFVDLLESPATFIASGMVTAPEPGTSVSGLVLDNQDDPVPNVTASIIGTNLSAVTDSQGRFTIPGAPVGAIRLGIDGTTTTRPGTWPVLEFQINTVCGRDNTVGMPIRLLPINIAGGAVVGGNQDVTIAMENVPGAELTIFANSVTFPDGSHTGVVSFTQVHSDKVPMIAPLGSHFMLAFTVQPRGTKFDPPARVAIPNSGMPPGTVVEMFSFDHDINEFVSIGTASVTPDGTQLKSNPGFGIRKAGWGGCVPPPPPPNCTCSCDDGNKCTQDNCSGPPSCQCTHPKLDNSMCCDGREIDPATQGCCDKKVYQKVTECCVTDKVMPKNADGMSPLADPKKCPDRQQNSLQHMYDGCSVPQSVVDKACKIGLACDKDNPAGGSDTFFSNPSCRSSQTGCTAACDVHDTCYQTCTTNSGGQLNCDRLLRDTAIATCNASSEPQNVRDSCSRYAQTYYNVLSGLGTGFGAGRGAFKERQQQYCKCCP